MTKSATPKRQKYPAGLMKVGTVLYQAFAYTTETGKVSTGYNEWIVRSIKARRGSKTKMGFKASSFEDTRPYVNLTHKSEYVTWGRRPDGKKGWLSSIPREYTQQFCVGNDLPIGLYTTQRAALVYGLRSHQDMLPSFDGWISEETDPEERAQLAAEKVEHEAEIKALAIRFKKGWPAQKKASAGAKTAPEEVAQLPA